MSKDLISIIENSKVTHPLAISANKGNRYWNDFYKVSEDYKRVLSESEYNHFINKFQLDKEISHAQYLQFASEVTVVDYIIRNYCGFKNEPRYNDNSNPECSFEYEGRTVNVEVKCPDLSRRLEQENKNGLKLFSAERLPDKNILYETKKVIETGANGNLNVEILDRLDNKLKDYLVLAQKKFPVSDSSNFNILVIAVDIISDMDEWYSYLFGETGAFSNKTYIADDYSNVDAVLLTNVQHGHMADDVDLNINCWHLENYISLLFLNPQKEYHNELAEFYFNKALKLFGGNTMDFLFFLSELDANIEKRDAQLKKWGLEKCKKLFFIEDKIIDSQIITEWIKTLNSYKKTMNNI
ncbi:MAG: hypothetical protein V8T38_15220 [Oscillospiraceae bacterium]